MSFHSLLSLLQDENMSPMDSSDSSDGEAQEPDNETPTSLFDHSAPAQFHLKSSPPATPSTQTSDAQTPSSSAPPTSTAKSSASAAPIISPLVYQTPQGLMYATPSNGGVIFSLAPQSDPNSVHPPQFITIPLSVVTANGQGELDLSKRKWPKISTLRTSSFVCVFNIISFSDPCKRWWNVQYEAFPRWFVAGGFVFGTISYHVFIQ